MFYVTRGTKILGRYKTKDDAYTALHEFAAELSGPDQDYFYEETEISESDGDCHYCGKEATHRVGPKPICVSCLGN